MKLCVITLLFTTISFAQVITKADTTKIRIGEQFNYQIEVKATTGVQFYKLKLDSLQKIEVIKSHKIDTLKDRLIKKFTLTSFDSGQYVLPKQLVKIFSKPVFTDSLVINVSTVAIDTIKQPLFSIKAIQQQDLDLKDYAKNYWWLLLLLPIIGLAIWYFFIRKKETEEERVAKIPPFEMAVQQLESLDKKLLWQNNKTKQYYSELTDIVRTYVEKDLNVNALESTTNELVNDIKKINNSNNLEISNKVIIKLKTLLQEADLVKFAKSKPFANEIEMHRSYAENVINSLKPSIEKYKEENEIGENLVEVTETITTTEKPKLSKKKKRNIIIIAITALFLFGGFYFGKKVYDSVMGKIGGYLDTKSTEQLFNDNWQTQSFGNPKLTFESPVILKKETPPKFPDEMKPYIEYVELNNYHSLVNNLQLMVMTVKYVDGVPLSMNNAIQSGILQVKADKTITDFVHQEENFNKLSVQGARIFGTLKENTVEKEYQMFIFVDYNNNIIWNTIFSYKLGDKDSEAIIKRVVNTLKIENAN